ncbi:hypothetical protein PENSTE_c006G08151 [Penicillium steckii]|uniref:Uncharacterized protein n=1 Tax=Penicillium steckii TaxID=303698 RepID=A0A1V6TGN9_9EURO|nr:hypothetical protein PENSTE_c006G08151 [Penicillium steckii]
MSSRRTVVPSCQPAQSPNDFPQNNNQRQAVNRYTRDYYDPGAGYVFPGPTGRAWQDKFGEMELVGARIPPQSYHGPHFERSEAQDELWNQRGSNKATKAHEYTDLYKKNPSAPWPDRVSADYNSYKNASASHANVREKLGPIKNLNTGKKVLPEVETRDMLMEGRRLAKDGRKKANIAAQARSGFDSKYPQGYESHTAIASHRVAASDENQAAKNYAASGKTTSKNLIQWGKERNYQVHGTPRPVRGGPNRGGKR